MKSISKKTFTLILASAILVTSLTLSSAAADRVILPANNIIDFESGTNIKAQIISFSTAQGIYAPNVQPLLVWAGGGKVTLPHGSAHDAKSLQLFASTYHDSYWADVTAAKTTVWGAHTSKLYPPGTTSVKHSMANFSPQIQV